MLAVRSAKQVPFFFLKVNGYFVLLSGKTRISSTEALFYYNNSLEYQLY